MTTTPDNMLDTTVRDFIAATAAKTPTPGGGSVAAVVASLATALGEMSLNFTKGKKKFAQHAEYHEHLSQRLLRIRKMFIDLVHDDIAAYTMYCESSKMEDGEEKDKSMELALAAAIDVPRETTKVALALLDDLLELTDKCNTYLVSDLVAAGSLAASVTVLCDLNVRINARQLDQATGDELRRASTEDRSRAAALALEIEEAVSSYL